MRYRLILILSSWVLLCTACASAATVLQVKDGRTAIVKTAPPGTAEQIIRLDGGTKVTKVGDAPRY